jgi:hypothetical protein
VHTEDIIRMAKEAWGEHHEIFWFNDGGIERFAAFVRADEREACAKVCEGRIGGAVQADGWWSGFRESMRQCAAAIRARSKEWPSPE